jgi:hypothetical protein
MKILIIFLIIKARAQARVEQAREHHYDQPGVQHHILLSGRLGNIIPW